MLKGQILTILLLQQLLIVDLSSKFYQNPIKNPYRYYLKCYQLQPFHTTIPFIQTQFHALYLLSLLMKLYLILLLSFAFANPVPTTNASQQIWPKPQSYTSGTHSNPLGLSPCDVQYSLESTLQNQPKQILAWYFDKVFKCSSANPSKKATLTITIKNSNVLVPTLTEHQRYTLQLKNHEEWALTADYYPGFVRGFETYSQLFNKNDEDEYEVSGIPIEISDGPQFRWRGLMIDTSRHFLPMSTVKRAIDSMLYSKLNVLHWHIVDEDAFPMQVPTVPQLSQYGSIGGLISPEDIKSIIDYAKVRAIRVVPEIDTPAHTRSWGRSPKYENITLDCNGIYMGQFDPTQDATWDVVEKVMDFVNTTFEDDIIHFGGDQIVQACWAAKQHINDFMAAHNITQYQDLAVYYRQRQKAIWRTISPTKRVIYWANEEVDLPLQDEDIIQWWGVTANVGQIVGRTNEVILANKDVTYLDYGFNNMYGNVYGIYADWRKMYSFQPRMENVNVIGGESCMWGQTNNKHTFDQKVVQRSSVIGERLWNDHVNLEEEILNVATRLTAHTKRLRERGFKVWPVTVQVCESQMDICF